MDQELILRAQSIEEQAREIEQNLEVVNQQLNELESFRETLKEFEKSKEKDMLSSLGKGVYVKTEITEKDLFVGVGNDIFVKKSPKETLKVIEEQLNRLNEVKVQLTTKMEFYGRAFQEVILEIQNQKNAKKSEKDKK